jgi:hypothetical protein
VKGNFHARFLGGCERATARTYPVPFDMCNRKLLLLALVPVALVLLITPFLARWGTTKEVARWPATNAVYGVKRPIWLSIQRDVAYVDIFSLYPSYRLFVTDGGYAYVREFDISTTDFKSYLARCQVTWKPDGTELLTPDGERLFIPSKRILGQIGPD